MRHPGPHRACQQEYINDTWLSTPLSESCSSPRQASHVLQPLKILVYQLWWSLLLRGIFILFFATLAFVWPGITLAVLMIFFGVFVMIDGLLNTGVSVVKRKEHKLWWLMLLGGLAGIVIGILALIGLVAGGMAIFYLIAAWLVITGVIRIITATGAREEGANRLRLTLGTVSVCFGAAIFIMSMSIPTLLTTFWIIALFALIVGVFLIVDAFRERKRIRETS